MQLLERNLSAVIIAGMENLMEKLSTAEQR